MNKKKLKLFAQKHQTFFLIVNKSFNYLLLIYLLLLLAKKFNYLSYFNLNYLLIVVLVIGVISMFLSFEKKKEYKDIKWFDYGLIWFLGIVSCILIYLKTQQMGWISYIISPVSGILIILLLYLVYLENGSKEKELFNFSNFSTKKIIIIFLIFVLLSIMVGYFTGWVEGFRIIFGIVYVFFLPGFILSFLFFDKNEIDVLERVVLSFVISIVVVPLIIFYLNLIGMKINKLSVSLAVLGIIIISYILYKNKIMLKKKK